MKYLSWCQGGTYIQLLLTFASIFYEMYIIYQNKLKSFHEKPENQTNKPKFVIIITTFQKICEHLTVRASRYNYYFLKDILPSYRKLRKFIIRNKKTGMGHFCSKLSKYIWSFYTGIKLFRVILKESFAAFGRSPFHAINFVFKNIWGNSTMVALQQVVILLFLVV